MGRKKKKKQDSQHSAKYDKEHCVYVGLKLSDVTQKDIIDKLNSVGNKQKYIKDLIRKDIQETK